VRPDGQRIRRSARAACLLPLLVAACTPQPPAATATVAIDRAACAADAVLLAAPAEVRAAPGDASPLRHRLPAGHPVYLCGTPTGSHRGVLFPPPGRPARCSLDPAACEEGWLPAATPTTLAG
jgi:hypothetical protein